jgi:hypothetical protein
MSSDSDDAIMINPVNVKHHVIPKALIMSLMRALAAALSRHLQRSLATVNVEGGSR